MQLFKTECVSVLIYGSEAFDPTKSGLRSLDFYVNCLFMNLFDTTNIAIISDCQGFFNFRLPSFELAESCRKLDGQRCSVVIK